MKNKITGLTLGAILMLSTSTLLADNNDIAKLVKDVNMLKLKSQNMQANLEGNAKSGFQIAGYAAFDWQNVEGSNSKFSGVKFAPIFHAKYSDIFQFEGELEFGISETGETTTELEYAAGTIFLNDYMGLQVGKFMSPIGQFVQNQHPSWINKLPNTPLGFGHDGAAPTSNIGIALRGGLPKILNIRSNYALFISNAPTFGKAADGDVIINATGVTSSGNVANNIGGRYALNPISGMEVGFSASKGEVSETVTVNTIARDYSVVGADFMYNFNSIDIKAEYVSQTIGENSASTLEGGTWKALYAQVSYQFSSIAIEPVIRYSNYHNPDMKTNQIAIGLNYLFANNLIAKFAYEYNKDENSNAINSIANNNKMLAQLAFGF